MKFLITGMEIETRFLEEDWDVISETSMLHLAYLVKTLLPVRWIGWKNGAASKSYNQFLSQNISSETDPVMYIPTGSLAEGIGIPEAINRADRSKVEVFSDFDLLCVFKGMKFSTKEITPAVSEDFDGYLDYEHSPPGYARICLTRQPNNPAVCMKDESGKLYFSSSNLSNNVFSNFSVSEKDRTMEKVQQGPAMSVTDFGKQVLGNKIHVQPLTGIPMDFVPAFICAPWPDKACSWIARGMKSEWLNSQLIASIQEDGCHIVGVPSKASSKLDIEWRLSFSASEGRLAREAVTDHQRQCYIYVKILRHQIMKDENNVLSSYMFKSVFLHCCEYLPVRFWKDYPGNCILFLLDVLLECLKRKHVPTYFLPENNLVGHLDESGFETGIRLVTKLRSDPIAPILNFTDDKCILLHPLFGTFRLIVQPVLDDMKAFKQHRDKTLSIKRGIGESVSRICLLYLREHSDTSETLGLRKHQEAIRFLADSVKHWFPENSIGQVVNYFGQTIRSLEHALRFYKAAVSLSQEYPELTICRGNLACIYHASAYADDADDADEKSVNMPYIKEADELFEQVYADNKGSGIDYVTFLIKQKRYEKALAIIEDYTSDSNKCTDYSVYSYSRKEMRILDSSLRKHIEINGSVTGSALSFAFYYMVKCLLVLNPDKQASRITKILETLEKQEEEQMTKSSFSFFEKAKECVSKYYS